MTLQLQAPLSLLLGYVEVATVSTMLEANTISRSALVSAQTLLRTHVHHVVVWSDASWLVEVEDHHKVVN